MGSLRSGGSKISPEIKDPMIFPAPEPEQIRGSKISPEIKDPHDLLGFGFGKDPMIFPEPETEQIMGIFDIMAIFYIPISQHQLIILSISYQKKLVNNFDINL
jgi:hypothetical protein